MCSLSLESDRRGRPEGHGGAIGLQLSRRRCVHLNRRNHAQPPHVKTPYLEIAGLWGYGAASATCPFTWGRLRQKNLCNICNGAGNGLDDVILDFSRANNGATHENLQSQVLPNNNALALPEPGKLDRQCEPEIRIG